MDASGKLQPELSAKRFLAPLQGGSDGPPPIWLMRQAGRYLPEYREVRAKAGGFLNLCYSPALAAEVTLQPIRRYGFDAAILFSDILVVPDALGQRVSFVEGEGPRLEPITDAAGLANLDVSVTGEKFASVAETVGRLAQDLPAETALIGFCGAPWTVATYMVGGRGSPDQAAARLFAYRDPKAFQQLMDILVTASVEYLDGQVRAGAETLMIFDSWAGSLPDSEFFAWVEVPTRTMVEAIKARYPHLPIIGFARGAGPRTGDYAAATGVDGIGCDTAMPLQQMKELASRDAFAVQGNLDPLLLVAGGEAMEWRVREILAAMEGKRHIFNLGHGIVPQTPPEHVARLVEIVREETGA